MKTAEEYERLAQDWVRAFEGDEAALARLNEYYERRFAVADVKAEIWRRVYAFRQRSSKVEKNYLLEDEARLVLAQDAGYGSWAALLSGAPRGEAFDYDAVSLRIGPRRRLSEAEWGELVGKARERGARIVEARGLMTDRVMKMVAGLESVRELRLGGSREMSDEGLLELRRMPQLEVLELSEYPGGRLTEGGLAVLGELKNLREFEMTWQAGASDAGVAHLRGCEKLERVDLMGTPTGDGAIAALAGKARLRCLKTGRLVTDRGLGLIRELPLFAGGGECDLMVDGLFSDAGLAGLARLAGVKSLDLFWHATGITGSGFAHLAGMENLEELGCDGALSGDEAMGHIGGLAKLKRLRIQESVATEAGFVALARSRSIESIWGRVCENFGDRAFAAFAAMPALRALGIGLGKVSDGALAALAQIAGLRELTPIGLGDEGFAHVGRCAGLERLTCMYCRESGDRATEHVRGLPLKYYYAGLTQITDRSLEVLGGMETLEQVDLYECRKVTDAGLPHLARLPALKVVNLDELPGVTLAGTRVFPARVRVRHSN